MYKHQSGFRLIAIAVILATLLSFAAGCGRTGEQDVVSKLFTCLNSGEYARIYQLLSRRAKSSISLVDFAQKYADIYGALGLTKTECQLKGISPAGSGKKTAKFALALTSAKLGEFKLEMEAPLLWEDDAWHIDWTTELILPDLTPGDRVQLIPDPASRGEIFDANGELLAKNGFAVSVYVDTAVVKDYEAVIRLLAPVLGMTEEAVRDKCKPAMILSGVLEPSASPAPTASAKPSRAPSPSPSASASPKPTATAVPSVKFTIKAYPKKGLTDEQRAAIAKIPGIAIDEESLTVVREYPYGAMMAQTLGHMGKMNDKDLAKPENAGLPNDAVIGQEGLEAAFEQELRGQPGYKLQIVDKNGTPKSTLARKKAVDGKDLRLTVDIRLQQEAEMLLRRYLTPEMAGCIVVTNPKTGYIEAIASAPSYDPNLFSFPMPVDVWKEMNKKENNNPFLNRATGGSYAPGSTFKPFTASMALTDGVINTSTVFPYAISDNEWTPGEDFGIEKPIRRAEATEGSLNLKNAITYSDNIFFAWVALKIGADKFYQHCLDLGITKNMPFDLPLKTGSISNTEKIQDQRMLADSGYGQGELMIAPVQMAMTFGSLGNGGDIMAPRIVQSICHTEGGDYVTDKENPKEVWLQGAVPQKNLNILIPDLKLVAQKGTAKAINAYKDLRSYEICAKTGTAEIGNDKTREIAWLIAFTTKKMDRLVCVTLEVPASAGSLIRTDIAREMLYTKDTAQVEKEAADKEPKGP